MGSSFDRASKTKSAGNFKGNEPVYDPKLDLYYYPYWQGDKFYLKEFRLKNGDTLHQRTEEIKYIVGSGHHTNSHFWEDNGFVFQAPITFYTQKGKWDLPPGFETHNTRFSRKIDIECMSCHTAMPVISEGSINKFDKLPLGIDCERCHGPGELHVAEKLKGNIVDVKTTADRTIVNPKRLPWSLQIDVCQRCHLQGNNVLRAGKKFTDFKPGMKLSEVFEVFMPKYADDNYFVMAGHAERFQKSACFIKSNSNNKIEAYNAEINFTCITCHNPHVSVRQTNTEKFNTACKNCHSENSGKSVFADCKITLSQRQTSANSCVKCHMPANNTADIPHVTVHDHYIRRPIASNVVEANARVVDLYSVNNPKTSDSMKFAGLVSYFEKFDARAFYLEMAAKYASQENDPELEIQYNYANNNYAAIEKLSSELNKEKASAWTAYRVAKAFDKLNKLSASLEWYKRAFEKQRLNVDFGAEYANALLRDKQLDECEMLVTKLEKLQQKNELVLLNGGAVKLLKGNFSEAKTKLLRLVALFPDNENAHLYLSELCIKTHREGEARKHLKEALRINPANAEARKLLEQAGD